MKINLRKQVHFRAGSIWAAVFFILMLSSSIVAYGMNDEEPAATDKVKASLPSSSHSALSGTETKRFKVIIDPGHGGVDPGAEGGSGVKEKDFVFSVSQKLYELLKKDPLFEPYLTRTGDTFIDLSDRAQLANELQADVFVSIHANVFEDPSVSGTETFYYSDNSALLAEILHQHVVSGMAFEDREFRKRKLQVLTQSHMPAALLEIGYLTNSREEAAMISEDGQRRTAEAIAAGLKQYFSDTAAVKGERAE